MHQVALLAIYCALTIVMSLAGGWIPLIVRLTHRRMQIAISFVSGMILGIGLLHLLPHSFLALGSIDSTVIWVLIGFLFLFFLDRVFPFHHHDVPEVAMLPVPPLVELAELHAVPTDAAGEHHHDHDHHEGGASVSTFSWGGAAIGLSLHSLIDGVAIAAAVQAEAAEGPARWAGFGTALAIALHKPFDSLTIGALLAAAHKPAKLRLVLNFLYALITPLGVLACFLCRQWLCIVRRRLGTGSRFRRWRLSVYRHQ